MTLIDPGRSGGSTSPEESGPVMHEYRLRRAHVTGRCPLRVHTDDVAPAVSPPDGLIEAIDAPDGEAVLDRWWRGPRLPGCRCGHPLPPVIPRVPGGISDQQDPQDGDFYSLGDNAGITRGRRTWTCWWH